MLHLKWEFQMRAEPEIYLIDDDADFREATLEVLIDSGLRAIAFSSSEPMLAKLDSEWPGVILCDVRMAGKDGFATLKSVKELAPEVPFLMITGHGDTRLAISAIKSGAFDFIEKPVQPEFLIETLKRALSTRNLLLENKRLRSQFKRKGGIRSRLLGKSPILRSTRKLLGDLAPLPITTLLTGEPGTGKALAAEILHEFGTGIGSIKTISCAALTSQSLSKELSGPDDVTTLFFRNVDKLEIEAQDLLASYIQKSKRPRIILSASCPGKLNDTLFYLASGATIEMPSLISMGRDVLIILEYFLRDASARFGKRLPLVEDDNVKSILRHNWPGNARELRTVAERMVLGLPLNFEIRPQALTDLLDYDTAMMQFERNLLEQTLRETAGRKGEAAKLLMIPRKRLYLRLKSVGLLKTGHN